MKKLFTMLVASVCCTMAYAQTISVKDVSVAKGGTGQVEVSIANPTNYTAFQFDFYLPDGLTMVSGSAALTDRQGGDHTLTVNEIADGVIRLMAYSLGINSFSGNSGALVTLDIATTNEFVGTATITMRNVLFTTATGLEVPFGDEICAVTVTDKLLIGDVNDDGSVTISDVSVLISYLLSGEAFPFNAGNADVNLDGSISIIDVSVLISYLLRGN